MIKQATVILVILIIGAVIGVGIVIFSKVQKKEAYYISGQFVCSEMSKDKDNGIMILSNCEPLQGERIGKTSIYNPINVLKIEE